MALGTAKRALAACLRQFDIAFIRPSTLDRLYGHATDLRRTLKELRWKCFLRAMPEGQRDRLSSLLRASKGQIFQDLFVMSELDFKRSGYFVEFGACNGIEISNTYLLEHQFGWRGILAEPCRAWHAELKAARECHISTQCVWSRSGDKLAFTQSPFLVTSTLAAFSDSNHLGPSRKKGPTYQVETVSLLDLLSRFNAPREIDYISLDTEGSEFDILKAFDFSKYRFRVITIEHNFRPVREQISALLAPHGYVRKYEDISYMDDWYVSRA